MRWRVSSSWTVVGVSLVLILSGAGLVGSQIYGDWLAHQQASARQQSDQTALSAWEHGGSQALAGAAAASPSAPASANASPTAVPSSCGGGGAGAYALVEFSGLPQYDYAGVAVNGDWTRLEDRSMVHWYGSPAPGGEGNVIIAFHREPDFQFIDQLSPGETVTIQDQSCNMYVYTITQVWQLAPNALTQLGPTSGHLLTLVTCTPWWHDYDRLVWRAQLTSVNGVPASVG